MEVLKKNTERHSVTLNAVQRQFWLNHLRHEWLDTSLPADSSSVDGVSSAYTKMPFHLNDPLVDAVFKVSKGLDLNVYAILISGIFSLLRKYLSADLMQIGTPVFGKHETALFANHHIPIRAEIRADHCFKEILVTLKNIVRDALKNQNYPVSNLRKELGRGNGQAVEAAARFNIIFVFENLQHIDFALEANADIIFGFKQENGKIAFDIYYSSDLYSPGKIIRINENFQCLLAQCLANVEKEMRLVDIQDPDAHVSATVSRDAVEGVNSVIGVFHKQVEKFPDCIALTFGKEKISYAELDQKAELLARYLERHTAGSNTIIGILLERSVEMIVSILAILKVGGCYLPLDPTHPDDRLNYILSDSGCEHVITNDRHAEKLSADVTIIDVRKPYTEHDSPRANSTSAFNDVLYAIYTSGTTGKPKGVLIENGHLLSLFFSDEGRFQFSSCDTWVLFHTYCFDFSVWEIFGALLFGGRLVIMSEPEVKDPAVLLEVLEREAVTVLNQTPSAFYNLVAEAQKSAAELSSLRYVIFGGEALSPGKLKKWFLQYPEVSLINMYGITETTVHVTYKQITSDEIDGNSSNIGVPLCHLYTYLVNSDGNRLPAGYIGEIVVEGKSVSRGYVNKPELTSRKFTCCRGDRSYLSGDLAYLNEAGELIYVGRKDSQVQLKGYRIELGEIESALMRHEGIENAIALLKENQDAEKYLCAYYVSHSRLDHREIKKSLIRSLPAYMIPSYFIFLGKIPLNHNGKIDVTQLPGIHAQEGDTAAGELTSDELKMVDIWRNNLGLQVIPLDESYFNIGGDSIKAIRLLNRINNVYNIQLRLRDIYECDTVLKLMDATGRKSAPEDKVKLSSIEKQCALVKKEVLRSIPDASDIEDVYPMADIQKGMAFYAQFETQSPLYHDQMVHTIAYADFDYAIFLRAVDIMCKKHDILRAAFNLNDYDEPLIFIYKSCFLDTALIDLTGKSNTEQTEFVRQYLKNDRLASFDLKTAPLWRIRIFQLTKDTIAFLWVCHHSIIDGWSDAAFKTELHNIYVSLKQGKDVNIAPLKATYKDFVINELIHKQSESLRAFWKTELSSFKRLRLASVAKTGREIILASHRVMIADQVFEDVNKFCRQHRVSPKAVFLTAYNLTLNTLTCEGEFVVGLTTHNRLVHEDGPRVLGCFLNVLPYVAKQPPGASWLDLVRLTEGKIRQMKAYDQISLMEIVKVVGVNAGSINPFFDTLFNYIDFHVYDNMESYADSYRGDIIEGYANTNTLLDFNVSSTQKVFEVIINYDAGSLNHEVVARLAACYQYIVERLIAREERFVNSYETQSQKLNLNHEFTRLMRASELRNADDIRCCRLDADVTWQIKRFLRKCDASMPLYFVVALDILLYKYTLKKSIVTGLQIQGGENPPVRRLVSSLLKTLPIRVYFDTSGSLMDNFLKIKQSYFSSYENPDVRRDELLSWLVANKVDLDLACVEAIFTMCYDSLPDRTIQPVIGHGSQATAFGNEWPLILVDAIEDDNGILLQISSGLAMHGEALNNIIMHLKEIITQTSSNENIAIDNITLSAGNRSNTLSKSVFLKSFDFSS